MSSLEDFARKFCVDPHGDPLELHPGQVNLLTNIKPLTVACWGRQAGKSIGVAVYIVFWAVTHPNKKVWIIAPALDQARIIFDEVVRQFSQGPLSKLVRGKPADFPFPKLALKNGTVIQGRGANSPQFIRGKNGHLIVVDEAAFAKAGVIGKTIEPMMTVTGKEPDSALILISTPWGEGEFKEYADDAKQQGSFFHLTSLDNPHADMPRLERIKNRYGAESIIWRTEYLAEFVEDDLSIFSPSDVRWAYEHWPHLDEKNGKTLFPIPYKDGHRYIQGVDLATTNDYFVAVVWDVTNPEQIEMVRLDRYHKRGWEAYKSTIRANAKAYGAKTIIDATSLASSVVEELRDINAVGYAISSSSAKYEIVHELVRLFSERRLVIPFDRDIIDELHYFQYSFTAAKNIRMEATQGHDDIVMAMALAAHQALTPLVIGLFAGVSLHGLGQPVPTSSESDPFDPFADWE